MTTVLILGGSGMLGHKLSHVLGDDARYDVHVTVRSPLPEAFAHPGVTYHTGVNLGPGAPSLPAVLDRVGPGVVLNAVGAIKQKDLRGSIHETFFVNGTLPHLIPLLSEDRSTRVVHFSTDCVFRGDHGAYTELDRPDVEDLYGRSKACGELNYGPHLTIRCSIIGFELFGHLSLLSWLFSQERERVVPGYRRAIYSGLPTRTLARTVANVLGLHPEMRGLYHVAAEPITKLELLQRINSAFSLGHTIVATDDVVIDRSLDDTRFREETGTTRPGWDELVPELLEDFRTLPYASIYDARRAAP